MKKKSLLVAGLCLAILAGCENKAQNQHQEKAEEKPATTQVAQQQTVKEEKPATSQSAEKQETATEEVSQSQPNTQSPAQEQQSQENTASTTEAKPAETGGGGEELFTAKGCAACHPANSDGVGPSLKKIAQAYGNDSQKLIDFLKGNGKPIVDPAKFSIMSPQINTTKAMSEEELKKLAEFILNR